jgi:Domain of unknown function (DUF305)
MSNRIFRSLVDSRIGAPAVVSFVVAASLVACTAEPRSLAEYIGAICAASLRSAAAEEAPFLADNVSAMTKMMTEMSIRPSGDVDFVSMMTPHHQGAIEMARAELRYGHNEQLRRMAQEIIVTQQQEIAAMRLALGQRSLAPAPSPDQQSPPRQGETTASRASSLVWER